MRGAEVVDRERMVNLGLLPYVGSKLLVLSCVVGAQCLLLFGTLKVFDLAGLLKLPGTLLGLPQLGLMVLTGVAGVALGLLVSSVVRTSEMATSLVPLILIPQILFSGLVGVPKGAAKYAGAAMPATWAFDGMKRLSGLDVLPEPGRAPEVAEARKVPDDLSGYVDFLHPWGGASVNPAVLLLMFLGLTAATILALRSQDIA